MPLGSSGQQRRDQEQPQQSPEQTWTSTPTIPRYAGENDHIVFVV
jgi:hypothetical protein